jgi:hypothetical protein
MPTIYPKYLFQYFEAVDVDHLNENFQETVSTIQGNLGEQNWSKDSFTTEDLSASAFGQIHNYAQESARSFDGTSATKRNNYHTLNGVEGYDWWDKIPTDRRWVSVMELTVLTKDCMLWLLASWQQDYHAQEQREQDFPGVQYCLAIDGTRIAETTIGGMDRANDSRGEANAVWRHPFTTDAFVKVSAGQHVVSLQARMVPDFKYTAYSSGTEHYIVSTKELIAMEIR